MKFIETLFNKQKDMGIQLYQFRPKEVEKINLMLKQVEELINKDETELSKKYWGLIAEECSKNANIKHKDYTDSAGHLIKINIKENGK